MIHIDGSIGGGQILRTSLSLSALTSKSFKIINIRNKRPNPGLQNQHLTAVNAVSKICHAEVKGNILHSQELEFIPSKVVSSDYKFDIGTAGSTTLVLQTLLPPLLFSQNKSHIEIIGGTANPLAPPALDIKEVFLKVLEKLGVDIELELVKEGFYPKGGGNIKVIINPVKNLKNFNFSSVNSKEISLFAVSSHSLKDRDICKRLIKGFKANFPIDYRITFHESYIPSLNPGCYIHANISNQIGMSVLGEKTLTSEDVGKDCALKLIKEISSSSTFDIFTSDQLLIYLGICGSGSFKVSDVSDHMNSNIEVIEKFLDVKFSIEDNVIKCRKL